MHQFEQGLLHDVRVLELCSFIAGPYCARLLGDLGAEVIKVEQPHQPDIGRERGPYSNGNGNGSRSTFFTYWNVNKIGVSLNIAHPEGTRVLRDLLPLVDVVVVDKRPGDLERIDLSIASMLRLNPTLVAVTITPFGYVGPKAHWRGEPLNVFHAGGEGYVTPMGACPSPRTPPAMLGFFVGERYAGLCSAAAALVSLVQRRARGDGAHVDISKQHVLPFLFQREMLTSLLSGRVPTRHTRPFRIGGTLRCKDGYVCIMLRSFEWPKLLDLMGRPPQFQPYSEWSRACAARETVNKLLEEWLSNFTRDYLFHALQQVPLSVGTVRTVAEAAACPQFAHRGFMPSESALPAGVLPMPLAPYHINGARAAIRRAAPSLGEHNQYVFADLLGYTRRRIALLAEEGIIGRAKESADVPAPVAQSA